MNALHYPDGERVEIGDDIWFEIDGTEYEGSVVGLYPRAPHLIKITYRDWRDTRKSDGAAKIKTKAIPLSIAALARRAA